MPSLPPLRVAQVAIPVSDLGSAKRFYGEILGLRHLFDAPPALAFFQCGETRLMLSANEGGSIILMVDDDNKVSDLALADRG